MKRRYVLSALMGLWLLVSLMLPYGAVAESNPKVAIDTSHGKIVAELLPDKAPVSVKNFLDYVADGTYNGTIFHRIIPTFMIQGGGFTPDMSKKPTKAPIKNEATNGLSNERGTLAMARTNVVDSATNQFFINVVDNVGLDYKNPNDYGYAVFGKVIEGMEVVDKIKAVPTTTKGFLRDVPVEPVIINSISLIK
jgi:peptidyl-prolyl cis-trans isomerase A (cyclophilin A)